MQTVSIAESRSQKRQRLHALGFCADRLVWETWFRVSARGCEDWERDWLTARHLGLEVGTVRGVMEDYRARTRAQVREGEWA